MSVLTLALAKTHLNITSATYDTELQTVIDSAEGAIEEKCGPLTSVAKTERLKSTGGRCLTLVNTPVVSLTSITPVNGTAYDVTLFETELSAGVVEWRSGGAFSPGWYVVVYQAGRATVPADLLMADKELVRHLWTTQRGSGARPGSQSPDALANTIPGSAFTFPIRVEQLIAPHIQVGN